MSEETDSSDKPHEATPEKLRKAREKGQIAKSNDLITAGAYFGFWLSVSMLGARALTGTANMLQVFFDQADSLSAQLTAPGGASLVLTIMTKTGLWIAPLFLLPMVMAILAVLAQNALVFTPSNLAPKLSRVNPIGNAKQKFGRSGLFEFSKSAVKLCIYALILTAFLRSNTNLILETVLLDPPIIVARMLSLSVRLIGIVLIVAIGIGAVDFLWQKAEFARRNRMSLKDLRDEAKEAEGDPEFKGKRRQKGQEIALNKMLSDVPRADVVIVNPTHYAVALGWDRGNGGAPTCLAKGVDDTAAAIRSAATKANVPIHSDPPTARALHASIEIGDHIAPEHYVAVAAAIRFADDMRRKARAR